jgi:hypothetical protein
MRTGLVMCLLSLCLTTLGCGDSGPSGVDNDKYIDELSAEEASKLCTWIIETEGGPGERTCSNNLTATVHTQEKCESNARPHCKVSLVEDCLTDAGGDLCRVFYEDPPQSCKDFGTCLFGR